jgi:hypothetical protein
MTGHGSKLAQLPRVHYGHRVTLTVEVVAKLSPKNLFLVVPGVTAFREFTAKVSGDEFEGTIELDYKLAGDRFALRSIRGEALTPQLLRQLSAPRVGENLLQSSLGRFLFLAKAPKGQPSPLKLLEIAASDPEAFTTEGPQPQALTVVALVYRIAYLTGQRPARAVQLQLGLPRSTAGRWISLARKAGLLGETRERKAGV